ncbi:MAG: histidinol-phosphate transaminase [Gammaproteobacteria bacterium]|nr:histidinol-phosphate transaminase [Gammaproteobacteria bacterium]|tara:strand:+ start:207674 stop:208780 length:1107 start_codon:yes stop_codon:yes gene_type:complete
MSNRTSIFSYKPGQSIEYVKSKYKIKNVIKLASNENPYGSSKQVILNVKKVIKDIYRYPDSHSKILKNSLVNILSHNSINENNLLIGNGSNEILEFIARAFLNNQSEVIFSKHSFLVYKIISTLSNAKIIETKPRQNKYDQYLGTDLESIMEKISSKTKVIFIANPNNPTGTIIDITDIRNFLKNIPKHIIVVIDEAYYEYSSYLNKTSAVNLIRKFPNVIVTRTFSKIYGLAGLRIGYGISSQKNIRTLTSHRQPFNINIAAQYLANVALDDQDHVKYCLKKNLDGMNYIISTFEKLGIDYLSPYGNFITLNLGKKTKSLYNKLISKGIILRPLENYNLSNYLRMTIGTSSENDRFVDVFSKLLNKK